MTEPYTTHLPMTDPYTTQIPMTEPYTTQIPMTEPYTTQIPMTTVSLNGNIHNVVFRLVHAPSDQPTVIGITDPKVAGKVTLQSGVSKQPEPEATNRSSLSQTVPPAESSQALNCFKLTRSCGVCKKVFPTIQQLNQHMLVHTDERRFKCQFCGRAFKQLSHLQQHHRIHTGEKPYQCTIPGCSRAFPQLSNLQHHLRYQHKTAPPAQSSQCNRCQVCDQNFPDQDTVRRHMAEFHRIFSTRTIARGGGSGPVSMATAVDNKATSDTQITCSQHASTRYEEDYAQDYRIRPTEDGRAVYNPLIPDMCGKFKFMDGQDTSLKSGLITKDNRVHNQSQSLFTHTLATDNRTSERLCQSNTHTDDAGCSVPNDESVEFEYNYTLSDHPLPDLGQTASCEKKSNIVANELILEHQEANEMVCKEIDPPTLDRGCAGKEVSIDTYGMSRCKSDGTVVVKGIHLESRTFHKSANYANTPLDYSGRNQEVNTESTDESSNKNTEENRQTQTRKRFRKPRNPMRIDPIAVGGEITRPSEMVHTLCNESNERCQFERQLDAYHVGWFEDGVN